MPKKPEAAGPRQGRIVAGLARAAAPLTFPLSAGAAGAVGYCPPEPRPPQLLRSKLGVLESAIVDEHGRLFVTSQTWDGPSRGALLRLDRPDAEPVPIARDINSPGGLALDDHGRLIVGFGDSFPGGLLGNVVGRAGLLLVDPDSGERRTWVTGLSMANGVARAADGTVFASNDVGTHIERIDPDGTIHRRWATLWSANGLALDPAGQYLYATQSFTRAAIRRIELADPTNITTYASPALLGAAAVLDGMTIDPAGRLYVAANGAGQIWRVDPDGTICALARGLHFPSAVALGRGPDRFSQGNLYVVTFSGDILALL
ncbi:MAG: SMP-30/gluconolactonase/LRE family protein [Frankiaceae bacterium]